VTDGSEPDDAARPRTDGGRVRERDIATVLDIDETEASVSRFDGFYETYDVWVATPARLIWTDNRARAGTFIILLFVLMGTVGTMLVPKPSPFQGGRLVSPFQSMQFPLGTTGMGQDLLGQVIHATPAMLQMITAGALFATSVATIVGTLAGYKGGYTDRVLSTVTDIMMTIPGLPFLIVLSIALEPQHPITVGIILSVNAWAGLARAIRSQVLSMRENDYVEASRTMGISTPSILVKDIIPNLMPYIMVNFMNAARNVIFGSVGLYFLGVLPFTTLNWGVMLNFAYKNTSTMYNLGNAHWLVVPLVTIILLSYGLILFAQGCDHLFNPRVRARHAKTVSDEGTAEN
jgi:peptide/nickel transport system permease protein